MSEGGVTVDKSPSPPKLDLIKTSLQTSSPSSSLFLSEQISRLLEQNQKHSSSLTTSASSGVKPASPNAYSAELREELQKRDVIWREHERRQIEFLQQEHATMLSKLHDEIAKLQLEIKERYAASLMPTDIEKESSIAAVESSLSMTTKEEAMLEQLKQLCSRKDEKLILLEQKVNEMRAKYKADVSFRNEKIRELTQELYSRNSTIAQITTQLHQLRLKEAFERQKQQHKLLNSRRFQSSLPRCSSSGHQPPILLQPSVIPKTNGAMYLRRALSIGSDGQRTISSGASNLDQSDRFSSLDQRLLRNKMAAPSSPAVSASHHLPPLTRTMGGAVKEAPALQQKKLELPLQVTAEVGVNSTTNVTVQGNQHPEIVAPALTTNSELENTSAIRNIEKPSALPRRASLRTAQRLQQQQQQQQQTAMKKSQNNEE